MKIFKVGTYVITNIGSIDGIITGATIRTNRIQYEISYFFNGEYRNVWLDECEFITKGKKEIKIGFK